MFYLAGNKREKSKRFGTKKGFYKSLLSLKMERISCKDQRALSESQQENGNSYKELIPTATST